MKIKNGEKLPDAKVFIFDKDPKETSIKQIIGDDRVIIFGIPGAFTPTCSTKHLPGFIASANQLSEKSIGLHLKQLGYKVCIRRAIR